MQLELKRSGTRYRSSQQAFYILNQLLLRVPSDGIPMLTRVRNDDILRCSLAPRTLSDRHVRAARYGTISTPAISLSAAPSLIDLTASSSRRVNNCSTRTKTKTNLLPIIAVASSSVWCFSRSVIRIQAGDIGRARDLSIESPSPRKSRTANPD